MPSEEGAGGLGEGKGCWVVEDLLAPEDRLAPGAGSGVETVAHSR